MSSKMFPIRLIETSSASILYSFGSLTAWLFPLMKTLAVIMIAPP
jgi:hypothetical protein